MIHLLHTHTHTHTPDLPSALAANVILPDKALWHFRLGHLSQNKLL